MDHLQSLQDFSRKSFKFLLVIQLKVKKFLKAILNLMFRILRVVMSWIYSLVTHNYSGCLLGKDKDSVVSYGKASEKVLSNNSQAQLMQLRWKLQTLQKGINPIETYIGIVKNLLDDMVIFDYDINNYKQVLYVLGGLGGDYALIITNVIRKGPSLDGFFLAL